MGDFNVLHMVLIVVIILILLDIRNKLGPVQLQGTQPSNQEHQGPGHGVVGQRGIIPSSKESFSSLKKEHQGPGHGVVGQRGIMPSSKESFSFTKKEHNQPGHGVVGQRGIMPSSLISQYEDFYTSGASLRAKAESDDETLQTIDQTDFANKALKYYMGHPF